MSPVTSLWVTFAITVPVLIGIETFFIGDRYRDVMTIEAAWKACIFWILAGLGFNLYVAINIGSDEGFGWFSGYLLEYMLSVDNLFCFHLIFQSFRTPKEQFPRALLYGIGGAVVLRFLLFALGASMFNWTWHVTVVFGLVLVYSGVKMMLVSEEDDGADPRDHWIVQSLSAILPTYDDYIPGASFFLWGDAVHGQALELKADLEDGTPAAAPRKGCCRCRVTMLFFVVLTLEVVDLVFAVDSITAKISLVSQFDNGMDLALNFTSSVFPMMTLRSLYFLIAYLVHLFRLLKYGVGTILMLIGIRLMLGHLIEISEMMFCGLMIVIFSLSVLASVLMPPPQHLDHLPVEEAPRMEGLPRAVPGKRTGK